MLSLYIDDIYAWILKSVVGVLWTEIGLDPNKLIHNPRRRCDRLKLTASAFNRLLPVWKQSWPHYYAGLAVSSQRWPKPSPACPTYCT